MNHQRAVALMVLITLPTWSAAALVEVRHRRSDSRHDCEPDGFGLPALCCDSSH